MNRGVRIGTKRMTKINLNILELSTQSLSKLNSSQNKPYLPTKYHALLPNLNPPLVIKCIE